MLYKTTTLTNFKLNSLEGEIGKVKEFYFDDRYWTIRYLVADTGTWLTGRQVLISPYALGAVDQQEHNIAIQLTKKRIEEGPSLDNDKPVSRQFEVEFHGYYEFPMYWEGPYRWGFEPYVLRDRDERSEPYSVDHAWDPNLFSTHDVIGHRVQASDHEIGHIEDFIIDDETWAIRYLVINTMNWLPGKRVLISPKWIERVSWTEMKVFVNLLKETIKEAPEYDDNVPITREYEDKLYQHYNYKGYWVDESDDEKYDHNDYSR